MAKGCTHISGIRDLMPSALGCEECLQSGSVWLHLRICRSCGHVGCCDDSPNRHATKHFHATGHPVIEGYDPSEGWGWCYIDNVILDPAQRSDPALLLTLASEAAHKPRRVSGQSGPVQPSWWAMPCIAATTTLSAGSGAISSLVRVLAKVGCPPQPRRLPVAL